MQNSTLELVKESLIEPQLTTVTDFPEQGKLERLGKYSDISSIMRPITRQLEKENLFKVQVEALKENGFSLFVSSACVKKFKFAANIGRGNWVSFTRIKGRVEVRKGFWGGYVPINYAGDIPEFALDRLEKLDTLFGEKPLYKTIHSNEPLPFRIPDLSLIDPVIFAWLNPAPLFDGSVKGKLVKNTTGIGVVVAMWDMDRELDLEKNR